MKLDRSENKSICEICDKLFMPRVKQRTIKNDVADSIRFIVVTVTEAEIFNFEPIK